MWYFVGVCGNYGVFVEILWKFCLDMWNVCGILWRFVGSVWYFVEFYGKLAMSYRKVQDAVAHWD